MKIKRVELIKLVQGEIVRIEAEERAKLVQAKSRLEHSQRDYVQTTSKHWEEFARQILDAVVDEVPVTLSMAPPELRGTFSDRLYFWDNHRKKAEPATDRTASLRALLRFLDVTLDDEISTTGLERQGFSLGKVLRGAV